jgi:hypothetical protein
MEPQDSAPMTEEEWNELLREEMRWRLAEDYYEMRREMEASLGE